MPPAKQSFDPGKIDESPPVGGRSPSSPNSVTGIAATTWQMSTALMSMGLGRLTLVLGFSLLVVVVVVVVVVVPPATGLPGSLSAQPATRSAARTDAATR